LLALHTQVRQSRALAVSCTQAQLAMIDQRKALLENNSGASITIDDGNTTVKISGRSERAHRMVKALVALPGMRLTMRSWP